MKITYLYLTIFLLVLGCKEDENKLIEKDKLSNHQEWSYEGEAGPEHWKELTNNSECGGNFQSPINLVKYKKNKNLKPIDFRYDEKTVLHSVENNGHTIKYNFEPGDYISWEGKNYNLTQFHFHEPAEHLIDGVRYPLAIHLVHQAKNGELLVIEILAKEGHNSEPFDFLESFLPIQKGEEKLINRSFDMNLNLPSNKNYLTYVGSLTTPPCSEGVRWIIFEKPILVSLEQVEMLKYLMPIKNYREEQPVHGRKIEQSSF